MTRRRSAAAQRHRAWPGSSVRAFALILALGLGGRAAEAASEVQGAGAVFAGRDVAIVWGVVRGESDAVTSTVIWIASQDPAIHAVSVDLVDPVGGKRIEALPPSLIGKAREARIPRIRFAAYPRAEVHFAGGTEILASGAASFTVYYTGVPATTPEFPTEEALGAYLESELARATGPRP